VVGIEDHFYNYMIYQLAFGVVAPVIDGGVAKIQVSTGAGGPQARHACLLAPALSFKCSSCMDGLSVGPMLLCVLLLLHTLWLGLVKIVYV